jgi:hypothetical protein
MSERRERQARGRGQFISLAGHILLVSADHGWCLCDGYQLCLDYSEKTTKRVGRYTIGGGKPIEFD